VFPGAHTPVATGIAGRPVPIEQAGSVAGVGLVMVAQLAQPFRRRFPVAQVPADGGS
jgi:hypothetical protein